MEARMASKLLQGAGLRKSRMLARVEELIFFPDADRSAISS
jgi:hypothetical protein